MICNNAGFSVAVLCEECQKTHMLSVSILGLWSMDAVEPAKPRRGKPRVTPPAGFAERCYEVLVAACRELSPGTAAGPRCLTAGMRDSLAKLYAAEEPSPAEWALAVRRRLELDRAGDRYGSLTWEHLCRPASFRRYRDAVDAGSADAAPVDLDALGDLPDWDPAGAEP